MMERSISSLILALLLLSPSTASAAPPDLCEEPILSVDGTPYHDTTGLTLSRWCEPRVDPPVWGEHLCCSVSDEAHCAPTTSRDTCRSGMKFWCEYGEFVGEDSVACYQPGPSACDMGACADEVYNPNGTHVFEESIWVCCQELNEDLSCYHHAVTETGEIPEGECGGFLAICDWGTTNLDGTVDCHTA